jgi:hypothetical protein
MGNRACRIPCSFALSRVRFLYLGVQDAGFRVESSGVGVDGFSEVRYCGLGLGTKGLVFRDSSLQFRGQNFRVTRKG